MYPWRTPTAAAPAVLAASAAGRVGKKHGRALMPWVEEFNSWNMYQIKGKQKYERIAASLKDATDVTFIQIITKCKATHLSPSPESQHESYMAWHNN
jgi:hypothetical protein